MSKAVLINSCSTDAANNYVWSMCFYKIDRRSKEQPYKFHKIRFKNNDYLTSYAASLMGCINKLQSAVTNGHWCGGKRPQCGASAASLS